MKAEIITIGDEILIGQIVNTNSSWLANQLVNNGIECTKISTVGDNTQSIKNALINIEEDSELIIITGGLGPTNDDITKKVLCEVFEDDLILNNHVLNDITDFFKRKKRSKILDLNKNQALVPSKAKIIRNSMGTRVFKKLITFFVLFKPNFKIIVFEFKILSPSKSSTSLIISLDKVIKKANTE